MKNLDFMGFPMYAVTREGKVYSLFSNKFLKPVLTNNGYYQVTLQEYEVKKNIGIHVLVARAFLPLRPGAEQVNHKDGLKTNNALGNLEWVTPQENTRHAIATGLKSDFKHMNRPVSDERVHGACRLLSEGWRNCDVAEATGLPQLLIGKLKYGTHYPDITKQYDLSKAKSRGRGNKLSDAKVIKICEMLQAGTKFSVIMRDLKVGYSTVQKILARESYATLSATFDFSRSATTRA